MQYQTNMTIESATVKQIQKFHDVPRINNEVANTEEHMPSMNEPDKTNITTRNKTEINRKCVLRRLSVCVRRNNAVLHIENLATTFTTSSAPTPSNTNNASLAIIENCNIRMNRERFRASSNFAIKALMQLYEGQKHFGDNMARQGTHCNISTPHETTYGVWAKRVIQEI